MKQVIKEWTFSVLLVQELLTCSVTSPFFLSYMTNEPVDVIFFLHTLILIVAKRLLSLNYHFENWDKNLRKTLCDDIIPMRGNYMTRSL